VRVPVAPGDEFTIDGEDATFGEFLEEAERADLLEATFNEDELDASEFHLRNRTGFALTIPLGDAGFDQQGDTDDGVLGEVPPNRQGAFGVSLFETYTAAEEGGINEYCQYTFVVPGADQSSFEDSPGAHLHEGATIDGTDDSGAYVNGPIVVGFDHVSDEVSFFETGGDSLLLVLLVERLTETSGHRLKSTDLFRAGTVRGHAELLADAVATQAKEETV
jgi:hypothetical protein